MARTERAMARLREIPNVGPRMAEDLLRLGVTRLEDAAGRDPGHPPRPWWEFTPERKAREEGVR